MEETQNLDETRADLLRAAGVAVGKVTVSALVSSITGLPHIGAVAAEIVGAIIPTQRLDRIADFMRILDDKLQDLDADVRDQKMKTEEFVDLFEDAVWQAARALTRERKEQIASFLRHSLYHGELGHIQEKTLLSLLNELNNAQIIMLKYHSFYSRSEEQQEYYERHREVLVPPRPVFGAPEEDIDQNALHRAFQNDLQRLGLLRPKFKKPKKGEMPEIDSETGMVKVQSLELSRLGRLLLRYIDLEETTERAVENA